VEPSGVSPVGPAVPLIGGRHDLLLLAAVVVYAVGFVVWFPRALSITDEAHYVTGAVTVARFPWTGTLTGFTAASMIGAPTVTYPVGTSLLQAPFVALFGWHAAALASVGSVCFVAAVLRRWMQDAGQSPSVVWLWFGFPPVLVMGRLAMSDVPAAACVAVGLYAYWKGSRADATFRPWLVAGLATGGSLLLREPLLLILGPFAAGALLRRERHWRMLCAGLIIGGLLRLVTGRVFYNDPFAYNLVNARFSLEALPDTAPVYAILLLLCVPGSVIWMPRYRGWRWQECQAAVWSTVLFFLLYTYAAKSTEPLRQLVLMGRYLIPLVPLLVWCASSTLGEWWSRRLSTPNATAEAWVPWLWIGAVIGGTFLVHPVVASWDAVQARVTDRILAVLPDEVQVVTVATDIARHLHGGTGRRVLVSFDVATPHELARPAVRRPPVFIVTVERSADEYDEESAQTARRYRSELAGWCSVTPVVEEEVAPGTRLRVHRVAACASPFGLAPVSP